MELDLLGNLFLLPRVLPLLHKGFYLGVSNLQDSLYDVGCAGNDVFNVIFANLIVQFF